MFLLSVPAFAADGDPDTGFNLTGFANEAFYGNVSRHRSVVVQPDGKIVAAGNAADNSFLNDYSIIRYNSDGSVDTTFGTNGRRYADVGGRPDILPVILLQPDGKLVLVGTSQNANTNMIAIFRFNSDGSNDPGFGANGVVTWNFTTSGSRGDTPNDAMLQPDGKILIAGGWEGTAFCVGRFNANGSVDTSFGVGGNVCASTLGTGTMNGIALQPDGKIVASGRYATSFNSPSDMVVFRFTANGAVDTTFDGDGYAVIDFAAGYDEAFRPIVLGDGRIMIAGRAGSNTSTQYSFGIARLNADGALDPTFDGDGKATAFPENTPGTERYSFLRSPDGKFLIARWRRQNPAISTESQIARFNADGSIDSAFGNGGQKIVATVREASDMTLQTDGKIVLAGWNQSAQSITARLNNSASVPVSNAALRIADFDGDGRTDASVYRSGTWFINPSSSPALAPNSFYSVQFGLATDKLVPADYDGDGKTDVAVWREGESGDQAYFYIIRSSDSTVRVDPFGLTGDKAVPGDYDGDGKAEPATFRAGTFFYRGSLNNSAGNITYVNWGALGDKAVRGDFDGDSRLDFAVFRPSDQTWYIRSSATGAVTYELFGLASDTPVPADFDGDGKSDVAVFRDGVWYVKQSSNGAINHFYWGTSGDQIAVGDYDGDGKADPAVWRGGVFYVMSGATRQVSYSYFGTGGDVAIASAYVD